MGTMLLTLLVGAVCGLLFYRLKVPGGMIVGAIIGTAALNIGFGTAYMPGVAKTIAQITAGGPSSAAPSARRWCSGCPGC